MHAEDFASIIISNLPYAPTDRQSLVVGALSRFCSPSTADDAVFMLNGYAGTGKSSICGALVRALPAVGLTAMLLAPTGRAAKVFEAFAGHQAHTIHRVIYRHNPLGAIGGMQRIVAENRHRNTVFIVDEASMITGTENGDGNLLEDLIHYVYTGDNCRMILVGDTAQLPPVGCERSPAMDVDVLRSYGLRVSRATLTDIARQGSTSGILYNATWLRRAMRRDPLPTPRIFADFPDVFEISQEDMPEYLYSAYNNAGTADTIVITRSNQRALGFNREIRASVLYLEQQLAPGEMLIVSKNNYFWTSARAAASTDTAGNQPRGAFLANGDIVEVTRIIDTERKYGFNFADVLLTVGDREIQAKLLLDALHTETANIPAQRMHELYYAIMEDSEQFSPYTPADARLAALRTNPYWNALHVKYAYAVTCHKAQGGQWSHVFVDMSYVPAEAMGLDFYRWLYTAETRATKALYVIKDGAI